MIAPVKMVVLGFRPKAAKVEPIVEEVSSKPSVIASEQKKVQVNQKKTTRPAAIKAKSKQQTALANSNWHKLKSLNTFKLDSTTDATTFKNIFQTSTQVAQKSFVTDQEWFGVSTESLQKAESFKAVGMLKTNVSAISLFPPPPPNKLKESAVIASKFVALDCEMVGVGPGGIDSALARLSLVNYHGQVLLDVYVKPVEKVVDFRTTVSGIKPGHITPSHEDSQFNQFGQSLFTLRQVQDLLSPLIQNKIVIGHSLRNDFKALMLSTSRKLYRDTSFYPPFRTLAEGKSPSLKLLAAHVLGVQIQEGVHDSVEDARIAMLLYRAVKKDWESRKFQQSFSDTK